MKQHSRFDRFRPVTVRAAARLVTMQRLGRLSEKQTEHYLQALTLTEPGSRRGARHGLRRLAQRRSAFGRTGVFGTHRRAGTRLELNEVPECMRDLDQIST